MLHICYLDGLFDTVDNGWRYDFALGGVPSLCLFVGFIFCPESPRYWLGLPSKFCSEKIPRNRLGKVWGYSAEKVLLSRNSVCLGIAHSEVWNRTERNGTERYRIPPFFSYLKSSICFSLSLKSSFQRFFSLLNDSEQNLKCFSLLQNSLKRNSEQFLRK
jgi:hypothetical protein